MKATVKEIESLERTYISCIKMLSLDLWHYKNNLVETIVRRELKHKHNFEELARQAFFSRLKYLLDQYDSMNSLLDEANDILNDDDE